MSDDDLSKNPPRSPLHPPLFWTVLLLGGTGQVLLAQPRIPWTLWIGAALMAVMAWKSGAFALPTPSAAGRRWEIPAFLGIFALALGAHFWRLGAFPPGLHMDMGEMGWCALRILHEGWRPWNAALQYPTPFPSDFYQLAAWFSLFGSSLSAFHLFFILYSLAALPLLYLMARTWSGPVTALAAVFFMAVMRWQWVEARAGHPSAEVPFYLLAALAAWHHGFQNRKPLFLLLASLASGLGLYGYQSLKALPILLAALSVYEWFHDPQGRGFFKRNVPGPALLLLILAVPLALFIEAHHVLGVRESEVFILQKLRESGNLSPLLGSLSGFLLLFNRQGPSDAFHNLPGHRMLDDATGFLFILGLAMAWRQRGERRGAYPLIGFVVMALPGLLTTQSSASQRYTGLLPLVAYFAALGTAGLWAAAVSVFKARPWIPPLGGGLLLCLAAVQNAYTYFDLEAGNPVCQSASGPGQAFIGNEILRSWKTHPGRFDYFIDPFFRHNPTVAFLAYPALKQMTQFQLDDWARGKFPRDRSAMIFLAGGKSGVLRFLQKLFPDGHAQIFRGPEGGAELLLDLIPARDLQRAPRWNRGLEGLYLHSDGWNARPEKVRLDPLIDFTSRQDFPWDGPPPYRIRWRGRLRVEKTGHYEFQVLTTDRAWLRMDGDPVSLEKDLFLKAGSHRLRLDFEKDSGYYAALYLVWKKPGEKGWEVVPAAAFGAPSRP